MTSLTREFKNVLLCLNVRFNHKPYWNSRYNPGRMAVRGERFIHISMVMLEINHGLHWNINKINIEF
jgi:hypothetical protein